MGLPRRALFQPRVQVDGYVAVKRIPVGAGAHIEPGEKIDPACKVWRLKSWYRRGLIGAVGDAWTEWALELWNARRERDLRKAGVDPEAAVGGEEKPHAKKPAAKAAPKKKRSRRTRATSDGEV